jgi:hypothetical protein
MLQRISLAPIIQHDAKSCFVLRLRGLWYIWQRSEKEAIHFGKQAMSESLIVEIVPLLKLAHTHIRIWKNAYSMLQRSHCTINSIQKVAEQHEQEKPQ